MDFLSFEKRMLFLRHLQTCLFLSLLSLDCFSSGTFLKLVHFRALSGWEDEMAFDSLTFNWARVNVLLFCLNGTALTGMALSFIIGGFYRLYGWAVALVFLANMAYPWGLAFHYVRSFHFLLLLGILMNAYGFLALAFFKREMGLLESIPETEDGDG